MIEPEKRESRPVLDVPAIHLVILIAALTALSVLFFRGDATLGVFFLGFMSPIYLIPAAVYESLRKRRRLSNQLLVTMGVMFLLNGAACGTLVLGGGLNLGG